MTFTRLFIYHSHTTTSPEDTHHRSIYFCASIVTMASWRAFSSPFSSSHQWSYDVFLSFRGKDTRKNFTNHLCFAFRDAGINTFIDDDELRRGENIATELPKAIQGSKISVIVFSNNYAASRWCLDELVEIMKCRQTVGQLVLPIFHNVDPSEVRKQTGSFGEAFARHEKHPMAEMDKVLRWKAALTEAANLSGWDLTSAKDGYEAEVIKKIVGKILDQLNNHLFLDVAKYPVGLSSRVKDMNSHLCIGSNDVRIIGICGIGGIGKTTLAKAILNKSFHFFEYCNSFLADVRENSKKSNGLVHLQEQLLYDILKNKIEVGNIHKGVNVIKERLCNKKVAIVLDDVDNSEQLNALARKHDWFGLGSRIIITSRDVHVLEEIKADSIYIIKELDDDESLELFSWHAFGESYPKEDYVKLSKRVIGYCGGLPLALRVLGTFLIGKSILAWKSALDRLENSPHEEIQKTLRISFDGLESYQEKEIFLDIAFFLIGVDKDNAVKILDGCGFSAEIGISVLIRKCLLTVNEYNQLAMHDWLRDMGREIVREESPQEPGKRSRLWFHDDVLDVLKTQTGTEKIEGLILNLPTSNEVHLSTEAFEKMHKLRLLQLNNVHVMTGDYHHFPKKLRRLSWRGFPLKFIPHVDNLVDIDMQYSKLKQVWRENKFLGKLKFIDLSHSHCLIKTPDFKQLPNLEKLILEDCISLVEVHASIGDLDQLVLLNLRNCKRLRSLPRSMWRLKSLEILDLSNCSALKLADETTIRRVLSSIVHLKNLNYLSLCSWEGLFSRSLVSILWSLISPKQSSLPLAESRGLSFLTKLYLADCNLSDEDISIDLGSLPSLEVLDLKGNKFHSLPASINKLPRLSTLILDNCKKLQSLPELPTNVTTLRARNCSSLESLSNPSIFKFIPSLYLNDCHKVFELPCSEMSQDGLLQSCFEDGELYFPGNKIPKWFTYPCILSTIRVRARRVSRFITMIDYQAQASFRDASDGINSDSRYPRREFIIETKSVTLDCAIASDHGSIKHLLHCKKYVAHTNLESGDQVEVGAQFDDDTRVECVDEGKLISYEFCYYSPLSLCLSDELLQRCFECGKQFFPVKAITNRFPHQWSESLIVVEVLPSSRFIMTIEQSCASIDSSHYDQNLSIETRSMTLHYNVYSNHERIRQYFCCKKLVTQTNLESGDQVEVFDDDIRVERVDKGNLTSFSFSNEHPLSLPDELPQWRFEYRKPSFHGNKIPNRFPNQLMEPSISVQGLPITIFVKNMDNTACIDHASDGINSDSSFSRQAFSIETNGMTLDYSHHSVNSDHDSSYADQASSIVTSLDYGVRGMTLNCSVRGMTLHYSANSDHDQAMVIRHLVLKPEHELEFWFKRLGLE